MQIGVERVGDAEERVDPRRPAAALEPGDRGLGRADKRGEVGLRKAALPAPVGDLPGDLCEEPPLLGSGQARANSLHGLTHISIMLYIAVVRYTRSIAITVYFVLMLVWIFWIVDRQVFFGEPLGDIVVAVAIVGTHIVTGLLAGSWWVLLLPYSLVLVAYPLGYPSTNRGEPIETWQGLLAWSPILVAFLALGVGLRRLGPWQRGLGMRKRC